MAENEIYDFIDAHKYPDYFTFEADTLENMTETLEKVDREFHVRRLFLWRPVPLKYSINTYMAHCSLLQIHLVVNKESLRDANFLELVREAGKAVRQVLIRCLFF